MYGAGALVARSAATEGPAANTTSATAASTLFHRSNPRFSLRSINSGSCREKYERNAAFRYKKAISADL